MVKNFKLCITAMQLSKVLRVGHNSVLYWIKNGFLTPAVVVRQRRSMILLDYEGALKLLLQSGYKFDRNRAQKKLKEMKKLTLKEIRENNEFIPLGYVDN